MAAKPPANAYDPNGPKAPGKPGKQDGFCSPKGGDDWVKSPKGSGWRDKKGNVWVPTGVGGDAHGGPHWDVQQPDGEVRKRVSWRSDPLTLLVNKLMLIKVKLTRFYSSGDERRFFEGLESVAAIRNIRGEGRELILDVLLKDLSGESLSELVALFFRYKISLAPLKSFAQKSKFLWLNNQKGFWYKSMFKNALTSTSRGDDR